MDYLNSIRSKVESTVDQIGGTEWEKKVKAATSLENWPTKSSDLLEIAQATNDYTAYREIMPIMWKRLGSDSKSWRVIYKTLILLDYIIRNGSDRSVEESKEHIFHLRQLGHFHFIDTDDKDRGTGIREKSKEITELLNDESRLKEVRRDSEKNRSKIVGLSSSGAMSSLESGYKSGYNDDFGGSGGGGGGGSGAGGSRAYDSYGSEDRWKNNDDDSGSARRKKKDESNDEEGGEKKKKKKEKKAKSKVSEENEETETHAEEKKKKKGKKKAHKEKEKEKDETPEPEDVEEKEREEEEEKPKPKAKKGKGKKKATETVSGVPITASGKLAPPPGTGGDDFEPFASAAPTAAAPVAASSDFDFTSSGGGASSFGAAASSGFDFNPRSSAPSAPAGGNLLDMFGGGGGGGGAPASNTSTYVDFLGGGAPAPAASSQSIDLFASVSSSSSSAPGKPAAAAKGGKPQSPSSGFDEDFGDFKSSGAGSKKAAEKKANSFFDEMSSNLVQLNLKDGGADKDKQAAASNILLAGKSMAEMRGANQTVFLPGLDLPQQMPRGPQPGMAGQMPQMGGMGYGAPAYGAPPAAYGAAPYGMPNPAFGRGYPAAAPGYGMPAAPYGAAPYGAPGYGVPNPYGAAPGGFPAAGGYGGFPPQQRPAANQQPTSSNNIFF